jgi:phospholipid/cholesterol/gamma-HCH transport system substrate-binding protein
LGKFINDEEFYHKTEKAIDDWNDLMADVKAGKGTVGKLWKDEDIYDQANDTIDRINNIVSKVERGEGSLGKFINDESLYEEAKKTLRNVRETSTVVREQTPMSVIGTAVGIAK